MAKSKIFFWMASGFLAGIFFASFFLIELYIILLTAVLGIVIFAVNRQTPKLAVAGAAVLFFSLGFYWTHGTIDAARKSLANENAGPSEIKGIVKMEPEVNEDYQKIVIRTKDDENILINTNIFPSYAYGDELAIKCMLEPPENFEDSKFDYQMYLAKDKIYRICKKSDIILLRNGQGNPFYGSILSAKLFFEKKLSSVFPDPEGAYLKGLLLGGSRRMTTELSEAFQRTGTSHAVAVSGYNVTVVAAFLMSAGIWLGLWRQQVFSLAVAGIIVFVLITGAPSSAVRAGIMGALIIWAMKEGRLANSTNAILLAASVMLAINPLLLRYDTGFQLSFLATLGIVQLSPVFQNFWRPARIATLVARVGNFIAGYPSREVIIFKEKQSVAGEGRPPKLIQETVILTIAATIFVLPVLLNSFEKLSLISPFANFLILPVVPLIMGTGFVAGMTAFIFVPLGKLVGFLPYALLKIELLVVAWMANLPWAPIEVKNFGWIHIAGYYVLLMIILFLHKRKSRSQPAVTNGTVS